MIVLSAAYQQACRLAIWLDINQVQMYANCSGSCCHWSFNIIADRTGLKAFSMRLIHGTAAWPCFPAIIA